MLQYDLVLTICDAYTQDASLGRGCGDLNLGYRRTSGRDIHQDDLPRLWAGRGLRAVPGRPQGAGICSAADGGHLRAVWAAVDRVCGVVGIGKQLAMCHFVLCRVLDVQR